MAYDLESIRDEYPFKPRKFDIGGHNISYLDEGPKDAPCVLLVHGNPTWSYYYRKLVLALRDNYRVIVPDHIGCGLSDKPADYEYRLENHIVNLDKLVNHLGIEKLSMGVHDWGGAIGFGWAARRPGKVESFAVFNTAAFRSMRIPLRIAVCRIPVFGDIAVRGFNGFVKAAMDGMATNKPERFTPDVKRGYAFPYDSWANRIAVHRFVQDIPLNPRHPSYHTLAEVEEGLKLFRDRPMLFMWGMRDFCFDGVFLDEWQKRFPNAAVMRFEDASHYVVEDAVEHIVPALRDFLGKRNEPNV